MIERTVDALGSDFVCYILACEAENLSTEQLTTEQVEILNSISPYVEQILAIGNAPERHLTRRALVSYSAVHGKTIAHAAHLHCGGSVEEINSTDPVESALLNLGIDVYAMLLLPAYDDDETDFIPGSISVHNHPLTRALVLEIARDKTFSQIFPDVDIESLEKGSDTAMYQTPLWHIVWSNGHGNSVRLASIPSAMLEYAFDICAILKDHSQQGLLNALRETVATSRSLATRKSTPVRAVSCLSNVTLSEEISSAPLGSATIRNVNNYTKPLFLGQEGSAILDFKVDLKLLNLTCSETSESEHDIATTYERIRPTINAFQNEIRRRIDRARFALLLASEKDRLIAPGHTSTTILNPLSTGRSASASIYRYPISPLPAQEVTREISKEAKEWSWRVQSQPGSVDMGMRRLLAAVSSRMDAMDGFVDAVICWENLFGTSEGESTFRVSGTMALLLEPHHAEKRKDLVREIRDLYQARSRLVHGSKELDLATALKYRNRAVELALAAFQAVYENDHLLHAEDSSARSRLTLLGY